MALRRSSSVVVAMAFLAGCGATNSATAPQSPCTPPASAPTSTVSDPGLAATVDLTPPERWLVLGMFPNPALSAPNPWGATRGGVDTDYLEPIGGEAAATITPEVASRFVGTNEPITVREAKTAPFGLVELDKVFPKSSSRILYAYAELVSDRDQTAFIHFGVDDSAKVWVNGKLVHNHFHPGRPVARWAEEFPVTLVQGKNRVLVKVDNGWLGAAFMFEPYTAELHQAKVLERAEQQLGDERIVFADGKGFIRGDSNLPEVTWRNSSFASWALGSSELSCSFYGPDGKPTRVANELGLYTAVASYRTKQGLTVRQALPLLRTAPGFWQKLGLDKPKFTRPESVSAADWKAFEKSLGVWSGRFVNSIPNHDPSIAILLSELVNHPEAMPAANLGSHASLVRWQQKELDLKRNILGLGAATRVGPTRRTSPAPVLRDGSAQQAGIKPDAVAELRAIATEWAKSDNQPFVLALARHGVLFLHEAFGKLDGKALPRNHRFYPASIGKNFAALVFAQFIERGWLKPNQLVGDVLTSWPRSGPKAVTFRQLFDHTAGLHGHTTYAGLDNPWLEEAFAAHILPSVEAGLRYEYEGDGGNIAAKAMELVDGRAFPILQREALFEPLGAESIDQWDCGWAASATALDMTKVAQMLLQKGAYGDWQFFTEKTWQALLPVPLATLYPQLQGSDHERGIGLEHGWDPEDEVEPPSNAARPPKKLHTVGHGSASSSIYRVDYQHDIVMVAGRVGAPDGDAFEKYLHRFVRTLDAAVVN